MTVAPASLTRSTNTTAGSMNVADLCEERGIHHTLYATGCIFEYDAAHPIGGAGKWWPRRL